MKTFFQGVREMGWGWGGGGGGRETDREVGRQRVVAIIL